MRSSRVGVAVVVVEAPGPARSRILAAFAGRASVLDGVHDLAHGLTPAPTVLVLGPSAAAPESLDAMVGHLPPRQALRVVLLSPTKGWAAAELAAGAGVHELLRWPGSLDQLRRVVDRLAEELVGAAHTAAPLSGAGRVITVFSTKGGAGTTMLAVNLAAALAADGDRVALVDADLEAGDVAVMLHLRPAYTVFDAARAAGPLDPALLERMLVRHAVSGVEVLAAPFEPAFASRVEPDALAEVVATLRGLAAWVVIDTSVQINEALLTLLAASDEVMLVAQPDVPSVKNLAIGLQTIGLIEQRPAQLRLVLNRADSRAGLEVAEVERAVGARADALIPSDAAVPGSVNHGAPLVCTDPDHPVSAAIRALAKQLQPGDAAVVS
ncbi:MAG: CpaE family protein [Acidimicrobiales bacterium]